LFETFSFTFVTSKSYISHKLHIYLYCSVSRARFTSSSFSVKRKMFSLQAKRTAFNYSNRASSQMLTRTALMAPSVTASSTPVDFQKRQFYGMIYKLMKQKNQNEN